MGEPNGLKTCARTEIISIHPVFSFHQYEEYLLSDTYYLCLHFKEGTSQILGPEFSIFKTLTKVVAFVQENSLIMGTLYYRTNFPC